MRKFDLNQKRESPRKFASTRPPKADHSRKKSESMNSDLHLEKFLFSDNTIIKNTLKQPQIKVGKHEKETNVIRKPATFQMYLAKSESENS